MDDFNWQNAVKLDGANATRRFSTRCTNIRSKPHVVCHRRNIDSDEGKQLLSAWDKAGHLIGNHTYSHRNYNAPEANIEDLSTRHSAGRSVAQRLSALSKILSQQSSDTFSDAPGWCARLMASVFISIAASCSDSCWDWLANQVAASR
jgi:peptidoglycan/xylan/chitin deacetylase (PgdA/CDA1 family)